MAPIKGYGLKASLGPQTNRLSDSIHSSVVEALSYPQDKSFHRFIALGEEKFTFPDDRSDRIPSLIVSIFRGRSSEAGKSLIRALVANVERDCGIAPPDIEIATCEAGKETWGIGGKCGSELSPGYSLNVRFVRLVAHSP